METAVYLNVKAVVIESGYASEVDWAGSIKECGNADDFAREAIWVVLNAGMKEQVARKIWNRIRPAIEAGSDIAELFGHKNKVRSILSIWVNRHIRFLEWKEAPNRVEYLETLPHIGPITKWHLAKNLGMDVCKPDRHLVRIAEASHEDPGAMCLRLSAATGDRIALVDTVIWRAANLGIL